MAWTAKHPLPFPILLDENRSLAKRWRVYSLIRYDGVHIARPASFIVDASGIVRYAHVSRHQLDQAPFAEILNVADSLAAVIEPGLRIRVDNNLDI